MLENILLIVALVLIIGGAAAYIIREKKRGRKCIGCPYSGTCGSKKRPGTQCSCGNPEKK